MGLEERYLKQLNILVWRLQYIVASMFLNLALISNGIQTKNKLQTDNVD